MAGEKTATAARFTSVLGLQVDDATSYQRYRAGMTPILHSYGGSFGYDFEVANVLASASHRPINRVFTLSFPDRSSAERFYADPAYLEVRRAWFEQAVSAITVIARFDELMSE
jgi:uncharacterized protein (DUF1330 family)